MRVYNVYIYIMYACTYIIYNDSCMSEYDIMLYLQIALHRISLTCFKNKNKNKKEQFIAMFFILANRSGGWGG